jgi:hypothetical protein
MKMAKASTPSGSFGKFFGSVVAVGGALHVLHNAVDGFTWAAAACRSYGYCKLRGQQ